MKPGDVVFVTQEVIDATDYASVDFLGRYGVGPFIIKSTDGWSITLYTIGGKDVYVKDINPKAVYSLDKTAFYVDRFMTIAYRETRKDGQ